MLSNLTDNPLHIFHLIYFEDFLNILKQDYYSNKVYLKEILVVENFEEYPNEKDYIHSFFQEIRKKIVNNIVKEISDLNELEIENYISTLISKLNNYKSNIDRIKDYQEDVNSELENIIKYIKINYGDVLENVEIKHNTSIYFNLGSDLTPFKFLDDLLYSDGFERLSQSYDYKTIHTKDYRYIFHRDEKIFFESWVQKKDMSYQMDFPKYSKVVSDYYSTAGLEIVHNNSQQTDFKNYLIQQLDTLFNYYLKAEDLKKHEFELICHSVNNIVSVLYSKYKSLNINHKLYRIIIEGDDVSKSDFKPKRNLRIELFIDLYTKSEEIEMFDSEELSEDDFLSILVYKESENDLKLKFTKSNPFIAYYLKSIEVFFDNLNPLTIEKSQQFYNKQNKLIKSSDLYTALSRGNIENTRLKSDIDLLINKLTEKYLE
ncbi:hypothetical protein DI487_04915 [Flavobacterium sediminis]|uniref:Uncharacterized protein n=1 Tax=Flavobacterium sediminis TaxID=2201181 RepID=A0A2U8QT48_9FLAO|nr:hypothetical protein [Flavobacterium sediminis]AWM13269.1 hypothetical protein DI487_04915 [Flavobacterium sediminis]